MIGETIGNFKIVSRLGRGGMGEVWLAEQLSIGTRVAIKVIAPQISQDTEHVQRFFNEARAVSRIQHAGIVRIFDVGHHAGQAYLIMEYLEGETLAQRIARVKQLPLAEIADIGRQIASVLDATHSAGITHRDLKPDNIYLVADRELPRGERAKILDFGIAKLTGTLAGVSPRTIGTMGTPAYMAPEQWGDASKVDWRADLYSLGCVAFEMACGRPPFIVTNIAEACAKHLHDTPPKASSLVPEVPPKLDQLLDQLLDKDPVKRPASMREVARAFELIDKAGLGAAQTVAMEAVSVAMPASSARPAAPTMASAPTVTPSPTPTPATTKSRRTAIALVAGGVGIAAAAAAFVVVRSSTQESPTKVSDAAVATAAQDAAIDAAVVAAFAADAAAPTETPVDAPAPVPPDAAVAVTPKPKPKPKPKLDAGVAPDAAKPPEPNPKPEPTEGTIDQNAVREAMLARSPQTKHCYEEALAKDKTLTGKVTAHFTIDLEGKATKITAEGLTPKLRNCLIAEVRGVQFPKPQGKPVEIVFPFVFQPETGDKPPPTPPPTPPPKPGQKPPPTPPAEPPKQPNTDRIVSAVQGLAAKIHECSGDFKGTARVQLAVGPDGGVKQLTVLNVPAAPKQCIERVVRAAKFEASAEGAKVMFPLVLK